MLVVVVEQLIIELEIQAVVLVVLVVEEKVALQHQV
jgi:hypothetical protein